MAVATATLTTYPYPKGVDNTQRCNVVRGTITLSTGTYPPGGFSLSWNNLPGVYSIPIPGSTPSSTSTPTPFDVDVKSVGDRAQNGNIGPSGFIYLWDSVVGNLHVFVSDNGASSASGPLVEYGGPLSGDLVNDTIQFTAYFYRNN